MQNEREERIAQASAKHDLPSWEHRATQAVVDDPAPRPDELPGWQLRRESRNDAMDPPVTKSIWSRGDSNDELIAVDVYRAAAVSVAHRLVLRLLDDFQSGVVAERRDTGTGDVAFGINEPTMLLFVRANCVVLVSNAGPRLTSVMDVAKAIDAKIVRLAGEYSGGVQPA